MATTVKVTVNTKVSSGSPSSAPTIALVNPSSTQVPVYAERAESFSQGEQPLIYCRMKDGTYCYIPQNLLTQSGGTIAI